MKSRRIGITLAVLGVVSLLSITVIPAASAHRRSSVIRPQAAGNTIGDFYWSDVWSGPAGGIDDCQDLATDSRGNVYDVVKTANPGLTDFTFKLIKYDTGGSIPNGWPKTISSTTENNSSCAVAVGPDDEVWATGQAGPETGSHIRVWRFTPDGSVSPGWPVNIDPGSNDDTPIGMAVDCLGNAVICGYSKDGAGNKRALLIKLKPDGSLCPGFPIIHVSSNDSAYYDTTVDAQGNIYVVGYIDLAGDDPWLVNSYDKYGGQLQGWPRELSRDGFEGFAMGVALDRERQLMVGGTYTSPTDSCGGIAKFKLDGTPVDGWPRYYHHDDNPTAFLDVAVDLLGNTLATGQFDSGAGNQLTVFRMDGSGDSVPGWPKVYAPESAGTAGTCVSPDAFNNVVVGGLTGAPPDTTDCLTLKYHSGSGLTWYLAEGYTGDNNYPGEAFDTYVLIQNPSEEDALVEATYMLPGGGTVEREYTVLANERFTIHVDDIEGLENTSVSTRIVSTNGVPVVCERSMYFDYYGKEGGHDTVGVNFAAGDWYLAEGYTGDNNYPGEAFDTYVLIQNPSEEDALVEATYMLPGGGTVEREYTVLANERFTIHVDDIEGLENTSVSTRIVSTNGVPVVCERSMYFDYYGKEGGHDTVGVNFAAGDWYLAEGYTGDNNYPGEAFDTYVLIQNPSEEDALVEATYMLPGGGTVEREYTVLANERFTIHVDDIEGLENTSVSTRIVSTNGVPVVCERSMYFDYYGKEGGHDTVGVNFAAGDWYLAEGYTGDNNYPGEAFDTYVLIQNPSEEDALVEATYMLPGGGTVEREYTVLANERFTIHVDDIEGLENTSVSTRIVSTNGVPVVCERSMYFDYYGKEGGHDTVGYCF